MDVIKKLVDKLDTTIGHKQLPNTDALVATVEDNAPPHIREFVDRTKMEIESDIEQAFTTLATTEDNVKIDESQLIAAKKVSDIVVNLGKYRHTLARGRKDIKSNVTNPVVPTGLTTIESYDNSDLIATIEEMKPTDLKRSIYFSIIYNAFALKQDPVIELFYPIVVVDSMVAQAAMQAKIFELLIAQKRDITGKATAIKKESLIKKLTDNDIFTIDSNRLYPVYRTESADSFVDVEALKRTVEVNGVKFTTAPLKVNKEIDILGISQTDELIASGYMDESDTLAEDVEVQSVVFKLTGKDANNNDVTEYHKVLLNGVPALFTPTFTDRATDIQLNYINDGVAFIGGRVNTQIADLAGLPNGHYVRLKVNLKGDGNLETGKVAVYPVSVTFLGVYDENGIKLDETSDEYTKMKAIFDQAVIEGYELKAFAKNENVRFTGIMTSSEIYTYIYPIPVRSKFKSRVPVAASEDKSVDMSQITLTRQAMNRHGFEALRRSAEILSNTPKDVETFGISSKLTDVYFRRITLDIKEIVSNIESSNKPNDVSEALKEYISLLALDMYVKSGYNLAIETLLPGVKPTVIIGLDAKVGKYLDNWSDSNFNYAVRTSSDPAIKDTIYMSFGFLDGSRNKEPNPLAFGVCFWSPEFVVSVQKSSGDAKVVETIYMPRFHHQEFLPILVVINITNAEELGKKLPIYFKNV